MMLPIPMSECPFLIAMTDVINSGRDVPIAMTVKPIIFSDNPNSCAKTTAFSTVS